jgi:hypothetical protein
MRNKNKEKQNGYTYTNISVKRRIDNNEFVKSIRKQLITERIKKTFSN